MRGAAFSCLRLKLADIVLIRRFYGRVSPSGTLVPTDDKWTGEGDWGQFWHGTGGTCVDRSPPVGYWCADTAPRGISAANHPGGVYAEAQRGFKYKNPAGAIIHAWMPHHWYSELRHCFGPSPGGYPDPPSAPVAPCGVLFVVPISARG